MFFFLPNENHFCHRAAAFASPPVLLQVFKVQRSDRPSQVLIPARTCTTKPTIPFDPDIASGVFSDDDHTQIHLIYRLQQRVHQSNETTKHQFAPSLVSSTLTNLHLPMMVLASETINSAQRRFYPFHTYVSTSPDSTYGSRQNTYTNPLLRQHTRIASRSIQRDDDTTYFAVRHPPQTTAKHQSAPMTFQ